jgi:endonuclease YncB( thermonuclease family)
MRKWKNIGALFFLITAITAQTETLTGKVLYISDGDTLKILTGSSKKMRIRLAGIDTPEKGQPYGKEAKQALSVLTLQKQVTIDVQTIDRYGRMVGLVYVQGLNVNSELVRQGMAWVYRRYTNDEKLYALEAKAKKEKRGLWSSNNFIEPWLWRRGERK